MPTTSIIFTNQWEMWSPMEMHYGEEDKDNHIGFGLQKSKRLGNKENEKSGHSAPDNTGNSPTAPPPNQEANKQLAETKKRIPSYHPGAWVEGYSDKGASGNQEPSKNQEKEPEKQFKEKSSKDSEGQVVDKGKVGGLKSTTLLKEGVTNHMGRH
ncbi:uncharacterized protein VP01_478g6 [Puccinia sorghi]|uniref:Uncharacterized protein n=1 Tax=Puccinia sorghi TaxID=27349 RepID=A0A0L6UMM4_9BASI|nr:uncharacterized protein VP01_478g6 [Puccinia sorghi]